jgi:DNA-binding MarR family transcriptional regulator
MANAPWKNEEERRYLRSILRVMERLRTLDAEMPMQQAVVLLHVILNEGTTQRDAAHALGMATSTVSRNIAALSSVHRLGRQGHDLLTWVEDPADRRAKRLQLTAKGRTFARQIIDT